MERKPQKVPLKLLRAIGCHFLKRKYYMEWLHRYWKYQGPVQIVYLNAYTKHKTNSIQPRAGFVIGFPKRKGRKESDMTERLSLQGNVQTWYLTQKVSQQKSRLEYTPGGYSGHPEVPPWRQVELITTHRAKKDEFCSKRITVVSIYIRNAKAIWQLNHFILNTLTSEQHLSN